MWGWKGQRRVRATPGPFTSHVSADALYWVNSSPKCQMVEMGASSRKKYHPAVESAREGVSLRVARATRNALLTLDGERTAAERERRRPERRELVPLELIVQEQNALLGL